MIVNNITDGFYIDQQHRIYDAYVRIRSITERKTTVWVDHIKMHTH